MCKVYFSAKVIEIGKERVKIKIIHKDTETTWTLRKCGFCDNDKSVICCLNIFDEKESKILRAAWLSIFRMIYNDIWGDKNYNE